MTFRFSTGFAALGCVLLASCYHYTEPPQKKPSNKPPEKVLSAAEQQKVKEQSELAQKQEDLKKEEALKSAPPQSTPGTTPGSTTGPTTPGAEAPKPPTEKRDFAYANKVPGKEGFVFSPFNNKVIDVRDIPSGTLVQDPTYPASEMKRFRVP